MSHFCKSDVGPILSHQYVPEASFYPNQPKSYSGLYPSWQAEDLMQRASAHFCEAALCWAVSGIKSLSELPEEEKTKPSNQSMLTKRKATLREQIEAVLGAKMGKYGNEIPSSLLEHAKSIV